MASSAIVHIVKLAVGAKDIADLAEWQAHRAKTHPPLRHRTRHSPKRVAEIIGGGSIYWVIGGVILVRQRITDIIEDKQEDGSRCAGLVLDPALVDVSPRPMKAFQGWRYLAAADAPPDLLKSGLKSDQLPEAMRRDLAALALL